MNKTVDIKTSGQLHGNVEDTNKQNSFEENNEIIKYSEVEDTPFTIINKENKEFFVVMGQHKVSEVFNTAEEALEDAKRADWSRVIQVVAILIKNQDKL